MPVPRRRRAGGVLAQHLRQVGPDRRAGRELGCRALPERHRPDANHDRGGRVPRRALPLRSSRTRRHAEFGRRQRAGPVPRAESGPRCAWPMPDISDGHDHTATGIVLGHSTYLHRGNANVVQHGIVVDQVVSLLRELLPDAPEAALARLRAAMVDQLPPFNADTAPGLVPNVMTGRIANKLDLRGPNYLVDAACASSLLVGADRDGGTAVGAQRPDAGRRRQRLAAGRGLHGIHPARGVVAARKGAAVRRRQRRHAARRGSRHRRAEAARRCACRRRPHLRRGQGGRAGERRPGRRPVGAAPRRRGAGDPPRLRRHRCRARYDRADRSARHRHPARRPHRNPGVARGARENGWRIARG